MAAISLRQHKDSKTSKIRRISANLVQMYNYRILKLKIGIFAIHGTLLWHIQSLYAHIAISTSMHMG